MSTYNSTLGSTGNMHFTYENSSATGNVPIFNMNYPTVNEVQGFWGEEIDTLDDTRKIVRIYFKPMHFIKWANGVSGGSNPPDFGRTWDTSFAFNDPNSWNFDIVITDSNGNENHTYDEFGVFKYQEQLLVSNSGNPYVDAAPGAGLVQMETADSGNLTLVFTRINAPFKLNLNITDLDGPQVISATNVEISGGDLPGQTPFGGAGYANRIYYRGDALTWVVHDSTPSGGYDTVGIAWYINVAAGISEGIYEGGIIYRTETSANPSDI